MRSVINRIIGVGLIVASIAVVGLAKELKKQVTFDEPVKVNGTLIKPGSYNVSFDETTGKLTISKGKKVLAKSSATLEKLSKSTEQVYSLWTNPGGEPKTLTAVNLGGGNQAKLVNSGETKTASSQ
jgi:hypothetical protein